MNAYDMLVAARAKIANPDNWTQGSAAKNIFGGNVCAGDPTAVKWCALGACVATMGGVADPYYDRYLMMALEEIGHRCNVSSYNDQVSHAEVLALFDKAIELAAHIPKEEL